MKKRLEATLIHQPLPVEITVSCCMEHLTTSYTSAVEQLVRSLKFRPSRKAKDYRILLNSLNPSEGIIEWKLQSDPDLVTPDLVTPRFSDTIFFPQNFFENFSKF